MLLHKSTRMLQKGLERITKRIPMTQSTEQAHDDDTHHKSQNDGNKQLLMGHKTILNPETDKDNTVIADEYEKKNKSTRVEQLGETKMLATHHHMIPKMETRKVLWDTLIARAGPEKCQTKKQTKPTKQNKNWKQTSKQYSKQQTRTRKPFNAFFVHFACSGVIGVASTEVICAF
jgi:hypothetical protein